MTDVLQAMEADTGIHLKELRVGGEAAANNLLMQYQADLLNCPVVRPKTVETTAFGAACLAGLAIGVFREPAEIALRWSEEHRFLPKMDESKRETHRRGWRRAIERARSWTTDSL